MKNILRDWGYWSLQYDAAGAASVNEKATREDD